VSFAKRIFAGLGAVLVAWYLSAPAVLAAGPDDLWEMTSKVEMPGMPMAMPPQTVQVCTPKGKQAESMAPREGNCKVQDLKQTGNKTTFKIVCRGPDPMAGSGEIVTLGPDAYKGTTHISTNAGGQRVTMTNSFSAKRVGSCTAQGTGNIVAPR
jgi:hypothetical protein